MGDVVRVDGLGGPGERYYNARFKPVRGENILRLTHLAADGALEVKGEARFTSDAAIRFDYDPRTERMAFSEETQYEVVNAFGTVVLQGHGRRSSFAILHAASTSSTTARGPRPSRS